jgi:hypothetical protein
MDEPARESIRGIEMREDDLFETLARPGSID